jgi:hypothetical protein
MATAFINLKPQTEFIDFLKHDSTHKTAYMTQYKYSIKAYIEKLVDINKLLTKHK